MPGLTSSLTVFANVAASQTDQVLIAATPGRKIRVLALVLNVGDTPVANAVVFNSKGSGAGTAIAPGFKFPANGGVVLPTGDGWFETNVGEGLSVTTAATGSANGILVSYEVAGLG